VNNSYRKIIKQEEEYINIPLQINFDNLGREDLIEQFEEEVISEILNPINDFETLRFSHSEWSFTQANTTTNGTSANYEFYFYDNNTNVTASTINNWNTDYENATFTDSEIYYFANSFKGSFFKLDFYDSPQNETQTLILSLIIPTQQGLKESGTVGPPLNQTTVQVKKPKFVLDSTGSDKEGFFIYWLKNKNYLTANEFYVSAKFFNAKIGEFVRLINKPQSDFSGQNMFNLDKIQYFYYKYVLDYDTNEYMVYSYNANLQNSQRVGTGNTPIKWYEYVNP
jgi:hypothetical protein